ncbi:MAG: hypothetical protein N3A69_03755, partial [Leptospiraceae bacterium]|nr:hypothetical protein [Leptospiraceae bacterium]
MPIPDSLNERLKAAFNPEQVEVLLELINSTYHELVKVSDFNELKAIVKELALAQKRTEQRVEELATSQKETQEELKQTQRELRDLARQVGGLAMVVGYSMEDKLYPHLEKFAEKVYKVKVQEIILRKNIIYENGKFDEVNIFIEGLLDTQKVFVLGECKAQASKRDIQRFVNILERFELTNKTKVFPFFVSYQYHP